jgi:SPX domain protein involved in polyphosphate accumulation
MKFGKKINVSSTVRVRTTVRADPLDLGSDKQTSLYAEWRPFYLDYNLLKRELKDRTTVHDWDAKDEREFTALLEKELDKIHDFQQAKVR